MRCHLNPEEVSSESGGGRGAALTLLLRRWPWRCGGPKHPESWALQSAVQRGHGTQVPRGRLAALERGSESAPESVSATARDRVRVRDRARDRHARSLGIPQARVRVLVLVALSSSSGRVETGGARAAAACGRIRRSNPCAPFEQASESVTVTVSESVTASESVTVSVSVTAPESVTVSVSASVAAVGPSLSQSPWPRPRP
jgi:hypothetical protein